ncbi:MAG TPA: hypothetical protein VIX89_13145 [Bryobacteraceae bacterium]
MANIRPTTITLSEVEKAVAAAVHQLRQHKTQSGAELMKGRTIMGRWIREPNIPQAEADAAAKEITKQVSAHVAGFKGDPFSSTGPGGTTMGFVLQEE